MAKSFSAFIPSLNAGDFPPTELKVTWTILVVEETMETIVLKVNPQRPELDKIRIAAEYVKKGGLVAFPTETVYGLGADALNTGAVLSLFRAKERPLDNPPIVHVSKTEDVYELASQVPPEAERLMARFWPGPLTLVLKRSSKVPTVTVAGLDTIAVRMPRHHVALALIRESSCPIAAPSANIAGKPSPTCAKHVLDDLNGRIHAVLDGGPTHIGVESTVLDLSVDPPQILRPGGTSIEQLRKEVDNVIFHPFAIAEKELPVEKAKSPGMKHRHYAPNAKVILVEGSLLDVPAKINQLAETYLQQDMKVGILATTETASAYKRGTIKVMGSRFNPADLARNLFALLREFDDEKVDIVVAEGVPAEDLGVAVMNRLRRAAAYNIIKTE